MEETDIYKKREPMPIGSTRTQSRRRRRRSHSECAFDEDQPRKRRSSNSGLRRTLHLARKPHNQRKILITIGVVTLLFLLFCAFWEFVVVEHRVREEEKKYEYTQQSPDIPSAENSGTK
jgi:hypothetical protein